MVHLWELHRFHAFGLSSIKHSWNKKLKHFVIYCFCFVDFMSLFLSKVKSPVVGASNERPEVLKPFTGSNFVCNWISFITNIGRTHTHTHVFYQFYRNILLSTHVHPIETINDTMRISEFIFFLLSSITSTRYCKIGTVDGFPKTHTTSMDWLNSWKFRANALNFNFFPVSEIKVWIELSFRFV